MGVERKLCVAVLGGAGFAFTSLRDSLREAADCFRRIL
jgi:hypothetical protein